MSCPPDGQLNIWLDSRYDDEIGEFQLVDESNGYSWFPDDDEGNIESKKVEKGSNSAKLNEDQQLSSDKLGKQKAQKDVRRFRSQNEYITACTIFRFLEKKNLLNS